MKQPHIALETAMGFRYAILPGDPGRLDRAAKLLENPIEMAHNREFRSLAGMYRGTRVLVLSTGIGGCSMGIAVEELHNIGVEAMIRVGSCGALQREIGLGDLILASGAVRDDGASKAYVDAAYPAVPDTELLLLCMQSAKALGCKTHLGVVHSHESFYCDEAAADSNYWSAKNVLGEDMETAALYTIGRIRGVRTASVLNNVVLWGTDTAESIGGYAEGENLTAQGEQNELLTAFGALAMLDQQGTAL
jgi:uridine phosphorylase